MIIKIQGKIKKKKPSFCSPSDKFNDKIQDYQEQSSTPELEVFVAGYSLVLESRIL